MKEEKEVQKKESERVVVFCTSFIHKGEIHKALFDEHKKVHYFEITKNTPEALEKVIRRFAKNK
jgi:hypothetical protein